MSTPEPIRVLILEDNPSDAGLMVDALMQAGFDPRWERCDSEAEFAAGLTPALDLILSDFALPQFGGLQALRLVRSRGLDVPFILVSGSIGEDIAVEAIRAGADDYLLKDRMARLGPAVRQVREKRRLRLDMERAETALRESEAKYRELIEQASDGIFVNDQQGRILLANSRYCEMLGYTSDELLQLNVADTYPDEERTDFLTRLPQLSRVKNRLFERSMRRKDGTCFPVEISVQFTSRGMHQGMVRDITERKTQEDKIARLNRIYAVLSSINSAIVRIRELQALFEEACAIAVEHGGFEIAWIGLLDPVTLEITPVAWAGLAAAEYLGNLKSSARVDHPRGQGIVGRAIRERRTVVSNDILMEQGTVGDRRTEAIRRGYRSRIALPLLTEGSVVGAIVLFAKEKDFFTGEELKLLNELASNFSYALSHIAGVQKIEKLLRIRAVSSEINAAIVRSRSKQQLFHEACRIAVEHGKFGIVWIGELDARKLEVVPVASAGLEDTSFLMTTTFSVRIDARQGDRALPRAMRDGRPVYMNDITLNAEAGGERRQEAIRRGYRSVIVLPLIVEGAVVGNLSMFTKELNFFDNEEVQLLAELAGNISFALESLARQEKIERLSRIRSVLGDINAAIVRLRNRQELFDEACRIAVEQCGFPMAWIGMLDPASQDLKRAAMAGSVPEYAKRLNPSVRGDVPAGRGTNGRAFREKRPIVDNDMALNPNVGSMRAEGFKHGIRAALSLPLLVEGDAVGVMALYATETDYFDDEEVSLLTELAGNISFALEHVAKQEKIAKLSRIRSVLGEINAAIVRVRNRQELFDEACRIAVEAGGFPFAWLGLVERDAMRIKPVAWAGAEAGSLVNMQAQRSLDDQEPQERGPSAEAVLEKKAVVVNDVQNDPRISRKNDHLERNINSLAVLPLLIADETVGVLGLHAREVGFFDEEEMKLLSELAGDIAFALQTLEKQEKLDYLAYYDALTGLPNRSLFIDRAGQQLRARGGEAPMVAVVLLNLDRFRNINETFGRHGGDELLKLVAQRLESAFNGRDYLARTAPDGFAVVMRGMRDAAVVAHCVESQVLECFRQPFVLNEAEIRVSARAGIAMFPADGGDADILFKNAEAALKKAKDTGERYLFYAAEMNARAALVLSLETRLRKAVELQQFVLHYQPKIHLASGAICGMEALIRWQEPGTGLVSPGIFIPVLEETGLILEAGKWVIEQALADHREWTARGCRAPRIAVNVSAIQLQQRDFAEMVIEAVQQGGNVPAALEIEITESLLMKDIEASIRKLSLLRGLGIHIAMDDFGTGYSSLSYIARLPINSVKIDRSFINGMGASDQDMAIVTTIVTLAHSLNLRVVAEGVETEAQSRLLMLLKCDEAQGYLFSRPVPAAEIEPLLRAPREEPASHRATRERTARSAPPSPRAKSAPQRVARRAIPTTPRKKRHHKT